MSVLKLRTHDGKTNPEMLLEVVECLIFSAVKADSCQLDGRGW